MLNRSLIVGIFVVAGLALFTAGLFLIGNRHEAFASHIEYFADFIDLSGLTKGAKVQVAGMDAGEITDIAVPSSPASRFRVHIRINDRFRGLVRTDSLATIGTEGVVGDTFLLIHPGSMRAPAAAPDATLPSKEPTEIADLLDQGKGVLTDVDGTIKNANGILNTVSGNLNATLADVRTTISNTDDIVVGLKQGRGPAGMLLRDAAFEAQIRQTMTNVQQATGSLDHTAKQADGLLSDINSRNLPQKVDDTMVNVKSAAANLDASSQQVHQILTEVSEPDVQGVTAGVNIRESLTNLDTATANMADDTEALKHNFFFKAFFRHRGYYDLANIDPEKYRKDRLFISPANNRAWLRADQLFQTESNGVEHLTAQGETLLNNTLAQFGDSVVESPIIIEGYSEGGSAASRLALSHSRAILVRKYLQSHFALDPGNLGAVPMTNQPPSGLNQTSWDGVCIVVVKTKA
jgi:phospholipid/cholesterol/gamma-HCH transport system substrate-binding protein